jgi:hypothetical protein
MDRNRGTIGLNNCWYVSSRFLLFFLSRLCWIFIALTLPVWRFQTKGCTPRISFIFVSPGSGRMFPIYWLRQDRTEEVRRERKLYNAIKVLLVAHELFMESSTRFARTLLPHSSR